MNSTHRLTTEFWTEQASCARAPRVALGAAVTSIHRIAEKVYSRKPGFRHEEFSETQVHEKSRGGMVASPALQDTSY